MMKVILLLFPFLLFAVDQNPFLYLEDSQSEKTQEWISNQKRTSSSYLNDIQKRTEIRQRLEEVWNHKKYGDFFQNGERYFLSVNLGLQNQSVLYILDCLGSDPKVLLDPNTFSEDGTIALNFYVPCGKWLAYGLTESGSDWVEIHVRDIEEGKDTTDLLKWVKFSTVAWHPDKSGFYYCHYDQPSENTEVNLSPKVYFHRLGTKQEEDLLIYERPDEPLWIFRPFVSEDGTYLVLTVHSGCDVRSGLLYKNLKTAGPVQELIAPLQAEFNFVGNKEDLFWIQTTQNAPRGRLVSISDIECREVIPQQNEILQSVRYIGGKFFAHYLHDAYSEVKLFDEDGAFEKPLPIPKGGTLVNTSYSFSSVNHFGGSSTGTEAFYGFTSLAQSPTIYRYDLLTEQIEKLYESFSSNDYETTRDFYKSRDGTLIPISICHKKGIDLHANHPTCLYGYGGFNIPVSLSFSPATLVWLEMGGIFAVAHIRGGSEYGELWHKAGMREKKQTVFNDFIDAAEWLIDQKITSTPRLGIWGRSNGGLLVGACMTQRPELFGAALPDVGVHDMLRFHLFTIGWSWISEFGFPDNPEDNAFLRKYSPLHNTHPAVYPPTLVITSEQDDRVVPAHSYKFAAALQAAQIGPAPILIRIESGAGHGLGKPTAKILDEAADRWTFLWHHLND